MLFLAAALLFMPSCRGADASPGPDGDPVITLVYAEAYPMDALAGQIAAVFRDKLYELSGGSIIISVRANGIMGSEVQVLGDMISGLGTVHMARISPAALSAHGAQMSRLLGIPFAFDSREGFWRFAGGDLAQEFLSESLPLGIRGLFYGEEGFRHFFTRDAVADIGCFAGMLLRAPADPIMIGIVESMGAHAIAFPMTELYSALQNEIVDGGELTILGYEAHALHEVAPNLLLNGHTLSVSQFIISEDVWQNALSENQRNAITAAAAYTQDFNRRRVIEAEIESIARLRAAGINITDNVDPIPWIAAAAPIAEAEAAHMPALFERLRD